MGAYIYTRMKESIYARVGHPCGEEVEVGLISFHCKPYREECFNPISKRERARLKHIKFAKYVAVQFKNGARVYKMADGRNWTWDEPHFGQGEVGFLFLHQGKWLISDMKILDSLVSECSAFTSFLDLAKLHPRPTLLIDSPGRMLLADAFDAWQEENTWYKGKEYRHNRVYRREPGPT